MMTIIVIPAAELELLGAWEGAAVDGSGVGAGLGANAIHRDGLD